MDSKPFEIRVSSRYVVVDGDNFDPLTSQRVKWAHAECAGGAIHVHISEPGMFSHGGVDFECTLCGQSASHAHRDSLIIVLRKLLMESVGATCRIDGLAFIRSEPSHHWWSRLFG